MTEKISARIDSQCCLCKKRTEVSLKSPGQFTDAVQDYHGTLADKAGDSLATVGECRLSGVSGTYSGLTGALMVTGFTFIAIHWTHSREAVAVAMHAGHHITDHRHHAPSSWPNIR